LVGRVHRLGGVGGGRPPAEKRPGTSASGDSVGERAAWIAGHSSRWQAGWLFWFVVTTTFAWSFFALGATSAHVPLGQRSLSASRSLLQLSISSASSRTFRERWTLAQRRHRRRPGRH
jgi:hypothetical protein